MDDMQITFCLISQLSCNNHTFLHTEELSCEDYADELPATLDEIDDTTTSNPVDPDIPLSEQP